MFFQYGWCLIRSKYAADINNGIKIFEGLCKDNPEEKRDYIYYLAIAYCRMKDYTTSQKYVKAFLEVRVFIIVQYWLIQIFIISRSSRIISRSWY